MRPNSAPLTEDTALAGTVRIGVSYTVAGYFPPAPLSPASPAAIRASGPNSTNCLATPSKRACMDGTLDLAVMLVSNLQDRKTPRP